MEAVKTLIRPILRASTDLYARTIGERPVAGHREAVARSVSSPAFAEHAKRLCEDGVVILPSYYPRETVEQMRKDFDRFFQSTPPNQDHMVQIYAKRLPESYALSLGAVEPYLTALASYYWSKPIMLAQAGGYRLLSTEPFEHGGWRWHHDAVHKQVKVMILLSDVPDGGQRMDYLPGTHKIWRPKTAYEKTRFRPEDMQQYGKPIQCLGQAGTVVIFDTNGLHRGNRSTGPERDIWYYSYTAGADVYPVRLHPDVVTQLTPEQQWLARTRA